MGSDIKPGAEARDIHVDQLVRVSADLDVPRAGYAIRAGVLYERGEPLGAIVQLVDPGLPSERFGLALGTGERVRQPEIVRVSFSPWGGA